MLFACWTAKTTDTHYMQNVLLLHGKYGYPNALRCHLMRTLQVWFNSICNYRVQKEVVPKFPTIIVGGF